MLYFICFHVSPKEICMPKMQPLLGWIAAQGLKNPQTWSHQPCMIECSCTNGAHLQVLEDVRAIISEQLGTDIKEVKSDSKFVDLGADSLDTVEIMMALEEKFNIQLDEEGAEKISTVQVHFFGP